MARITLSVVAIKEMPNELINALRNKSSFQTVVKLSHVHSWGKNCGLPAAVSVAGLNDSMMIHTTGRRHQTRMMSDPMIVVGPILCFITAPLGPRPDRL